MTERLYYADPYLASFDAEIVDASPDGLRVYLDCTAFYPASGGQPFELGQLAGIPVTEVVDEGSRIAHVVASPLPSVRVRGQIDWPRRFDHMQQHSGQHLLSAVFANLLNAATVSFHLGAESATIDLATPALSPGQIQAVEQRANEIVFENRPISIAFEHASEAAGLRKPSDREGDLRIITIQDLDRSACGGTHVRATGEIGPILIRKLDKVRGNVRLEFLCGLRAVKRARADYDALSQIAGAVSASLDQTPAIVAMQMEKSQESAKSLRRLSAELAAARGRELYSSTPPGPSGLRLSIQRVERITEDQRAEALSFTAGSKAIMLLLGEDPASVLVAASKDSGFNVGQWLKTALAEAGGRGGGNATVAQGSVPSIEALQTIEGAMQSGVQSLA